MALPVSMHILNEGTDNELRYVVVSVQDTNTRKKELRLDEYNRYNSLNRHIGYTTGPILNNKGHMVYGDILIGMPMPFKNLLKQFTEEGEE